MKKSPSARIPKKAEPSRAKKLPLRKRDGKEGKKSAKDAAQKEPLESPDATRPATFPIVGIGASAGGLEALTQLLEHLPAQPHMALVVVQHLAPKHQSLLPELLARATRLKVHQVADETLVKPDHIYVIPPNCFMSIRNGVLILKPRTLTRGQHMPVDHFLRALARDAQHRAVGVILSGTASDGAMGMEAIKSEGGITFAQDSASARFAGMPEAAVATGCVDFVLTPAAIAHELERIGQHPYVNGDHAAHPESAVPEHDRDIQAVFLLLRNATGVDFTHYKHATIRRRIGRRMALLKTEKMSEYVRHLRGHPQELAALYKDVLIKVTNFFRDAAVFAFLKKKIFPQLTKGRPPDSPVRIWVPGCSTGEEAYSIAISLVEYFKKTRRGFPVQIFATDLSEDVLEKARTGIFIENIATDVSPERLRQFFVKGKGTYQVTKTIREMVVFAKQNIAKDPPFSRLDMVSCRNVLIYLGPALQHKVFPIFHYALRPGGFLMLGTSETVGSFAEFFSLVDKKSKIFARKNVMPRAKLDFTGGSVPVASQPVELERGTRIPASSDHDVQKEADRVLLQRYTPPGVVVNEHLEILQFRGQTSPYMDPAPGRASLSLLKMLKEGLAAQLRSALNKMRKSLLPVKSRVSFTEGAQKREVVLEIIPLPLGPARSRHFLILFHELGNHSTGKTTEPPQHGESLRKEGRGEISKLKQELDATREYLQSVIEEQEATNEELKSANEEIMSSNEELQSTNEELETAKEELQSANEELQTVNEELHGRNVELLEANSDLANLFNNINVGVVMLGEDRRVRRFTAAAARMFNLIPTDVGRPFTDIKSNLQHVDLPRLMREATEHVAARELEVQDREGRWYFLSIRPYVTTDNKLDGQVLALVDIDAIKRSSEARDFADAIITAVNEPLVVLDVDLRIRRANQAFYERFDLTADASHGRTLAELEDGPWGRARLPEKLSAVVHEGTPLDDFALDYDFPDVGTRRLLLRARKIPAAQLRPPLILLAIEDVTERQEIEQRLVEISQHEQRRLAQELHDGLAQQLTGAAMLAHAAGTRLADRSQPEATDIQDVIHQINLAVRYTRELAQGLHPLEIKAAHFQTVMEAMASNVGHLFKVSCAFHADKRCQVADDMTATELYRIAQEAVNNALKHSKARHIKIELTMHERHPCLTIRDDGIGYRRSPSTDRGLGLQIMKYRAGRISAALNVERNPAGGTLVSVMLSRVGRPAAVSD